MRRSFLAGLVCVLLLAVGAAQASAVTVTISPGGVMTGAASTAATLHDGTATATLGGCTMVGTWSSATAAAYPVPFSGAVAVATPADDTAGNLQLSCTSCRLGIAACSFRCDLASNVMAMGATVLGVTALRVTRIRCTIGIACSATLASSGGATHGGGVAATFDNGPPSLSIDAPTGSNQNLGISGSTCGTRLPNTAAATLSGPSSGGLVFATNQTVN